MRKTFDEVFEDRTRYGTKIKTDEYKECGAYIIIDQGQEQIAGFTDIEEGLLEEVPAIIFGDHTRVVKYVDEPFFLGADGVKVLRSRYENANYKYLYYALKNANIPNTGYNRHFKWLKEVKIEYPDMDKQAEIVDILDKITTVIQVRKAELLKLDKLIKARFVEMFGDAPTKLVEDACDSFKIGPFGSALHKNEMATEGFAFVLGTDNAVKNEFAYKEIRYIDENKYTELEKYTVKPGDVIMSMMGTVGRVAVVPEDIGTAIISSHLCILKVNRQLMYPEFFHLAFCKDDVIQHQIDGIHNGSIMKGFNLKIVKAFTIKCPALNEQKVFLDFVKQVDKSKVAVQKAIDEAQLLFDSLMQQYFG